MNNRNRFIHEMVNTIHYFDIADTSLASSFLGEAFDALMDEVREDVREYPNTGTGINNTETAISQLEDKLSAALAQRDDARSQLAEVLGERNDALDKRDAAVADAESVRELNSQVCANWHEDKERFNDTLNMLRNDIERLQDRVSVAESMRELAETMTNKRSKQLNKLDKDFRGFLHHLAATPMEDALSARRLVAKFEAYREDNK